MILGISTLFYGPAKHFNIPNNIYITIIALIFAGFFVPYTMIPIMEEMIGEALIWVSNKANDKDIINDLCSGLFNFMFCIGNILGPLLGNWGYVKIGLELTTEYVAYFTILFGFAYFFLCDDLFYRKPPLELDESSLLLDKTTSD